MVRVTHPRTSVLGTNMMKRILITIAIILVVAIIVVGIMLKNGVSITITESEIQSAVYKKFPMEITHFLILRMEYTNPVVELIDNKERVRLGLTLSPVLEVNGKRHTGTVVVNGGFRYEPGLGHVYLTGFQVETLQLDGYKSVQLDKISEAISNRLEDVYSKYPIYTLGDDVKEKTVKMLVRDVTIRNKAVTILLGP